MLVLIRLPASPNLKILMSNSRRQDRTPGIDDAASLLNLKAVDGDFLPYSAFRPRVILNTGRVLTNH